jgi:hypothetical protein
MFPGETFDFNVISVQFPSCVKPVFQMEVTRHDRISSYMTSPLASQRLHGGVQARRFGRAQLTLAEHALCPLDPSVSLTPNYIHETCYLFTDKHRNRRTAKARIGGLDGMSAHDEVYLWGLLAIALSQPESRPEFMATPYYCLRQLGIISGDKHGGREFELFRAAIRRLAGMRYQNDAFYDPIRGEHRAVSFGLLNYSLPLDADSSRAWRFAWDPIFFELAQATGGALSFDLALYRQFDPATRRLYLYLKKIFWRREATGRLDVRNLAVDVLGFAPTIETSHLKRKLVRCIEEMLDLRLLQLPSDAKTIKDLFEKQSKGIYTLRLHRGDRFNAFPETAIPTSDESPLVEPLLAIGFDNASIRRIMCRYSAKLIEQWVDITLAAKEHNGDKFFTTSPQAYFTDNIKEASSKRRTPPDWWRELRKKELQQRRDQERAKAGLLLDAPSHDDKSFDEYLENEAREAFERITRKLLGDFQKAGQSEPLARDNARRMARTHFMNRYRQEHPEAGLQ